MTNPLPAELTTTTAVAVLSAEHTHTYTPLHARIQANHDKHSLEDYNKHYLQNSPLLLCLLCQVQNTLHLQVWLLESFQNQDTHGRCHHHHKPLLLDNSKCTWVADYYSGNHPSLCTRDSCSPQTGPDRLLIHPDEIFRHIKSVYSLLKAADETRDGA